MSPTVARTCALACVFAVTACGERASGEIALTLLGTTDVHGHLVPYEYATGEPAPHSLAQVATLVDSVRRADPAVLLFDSGDLLQGTPLDEYQARVGRGAVHPVVAAMNGLGYDASAIGNHEFNYGLPYLHAAIERARFPFLAANIYVEGTDSLAFRPYALLEAGGVRVGVIGFTTPGVAIWDRGHVEGRLRFEDIVASAHRWVPRMREAGAEVVVALAHSGLGPGSSYGASEGVPEEDAVARLAEEGPSIDVIFAG
ncbi:MAG: metallophosphoesterase, partial [Gemmatimonadota bacterium]